MNDKMYAKINDDGSYAFIIELPLSYFIKNLPATLSDMYTHAYAPQVIMKRDDIDSLISSNKLVIIQKDSPDYLMFAPFETYGRP